MAGERTKLIAQRILRIVGDPAGKKYQRPEVVLEVKEAQKELCEKYYALKVKNSVAMAQGQDSYDVNGIVWKIKQFYLPTTWTEGFEILNDANLFEQYRQNTGVQALSKPRYGLIWNKVLTVLPAPQEDGDELNFDAYGLPDEELTIAKDPQVDEAWDDALIFGAVSRLDPKAVDGAGVPYRKVFESEAAERSGLMMRESIAATTQRQHWSGRLNF